MAGEPCADSIACEAYLRVNRLFPGKSPGRYRAGSCVFEGRCTCEGLPFGVARGMMAAFNVGRPEMQAMPGKRKRAVRRSQTAP